MNRTETANLDAKSKPPKQFVENLLIKQQIFALGI